MADPAIGDTVSCDVRSRRFASRGCGSALCQTMQRRTWQRLAVPRPQADRAFAAVVVVDGVVRPEPGKLHGSGLVHLMRDEGVLVKGGGILDAGSIFVEP